METTVVRYKIKPECAEENIRFIKGLFDELRATGAQDIRYACLRLDDETFVHITQSGPAATTSISKLAAFAPYQAELPQRLADKPNPCDATIIDNYGMLTEAALTL